MGPKRKIGLLIRNKLLDLSLWVDIHTVEPYDPKNFPSLNLTDEEEEAYFAAIEDKPYVPIFDDTSEHLEHCNQGEFIGTCRYGDDIYGDGCPALTEEQNAERREELEDEGAIEG